MRRAPPFGAINIGTSNVFLFDLLLGTVSGIAQVRCISVKGNINLLNFMKSLATIVMNLPKVD